jgi:hypothetical protein
MPHMRLAPSSPGQPDLADGFASDSPPSVFETADAARVGGGIYEFLLAAACHLATDPMPQVEMLGAAALAVLNVQLEPLKNYLQGGAAF